MIPAQQPRAQPPQGGMRLFHRASPLAPPPPRTGPCQRVVARAESLCGRPPHARVAEGPAGVWHPGRLVGRSRRGRRALPPLGGTGPGRRWWCRRWQLPSPGRAGSASLTPSLAHSLSAGRARGARLDGLQGGCTDTCIDAEPGVVCRSMAERGAAQPASAEGDVSVYISKGSCSLLTGVSSIPGTGPGGPRWRRILDAASEV